MAQIAVKDSLGAFWRSGSGVFNAFNDPLSWSTVTVHTSSWTFINADLSAALSNLASPKTYILFLRGADVAGNQTRPTSEPGGGSLMRIDSNKPVSIATVPANNSGVTGQVIPIQGTADDQSASGTPGVGLSQVRLKAIQIDSIGTRKYWDGGNWAGTDQGFNLPTTMPGGAQNVLTFQSQAASLPDSAFYNPGGGPAVFDG